jgi:phosphate transport system protein
MAVRTIFDQQLCTLRGRVQQLAQMVAGSIDESITALKTRDHVKAQQVSDYDAQINKLRFEIEEEAYKILALQAPVSSDMRMIVATISVVTNLERIGDYAAGIARLVLRMTDRFEIVPMPEFDKMGQILKGMLEDAIYAYTERNQSAAMSVIERDEQVNQLHKLVYETLITRMTHDANMVENGTFALWISHNLERIGDRCANICERVNYLVTGELTHQHAHAE